MFQLPARYEAVAPLGQGAFGEVHSAVLAARPVAIKVLGEAWLGRPDVVWRFGAEYRRLAALSHPAFPAAVEEGLDGAGRPYYAMELVPGRSPAPGMDARRVLRGVAEGLLALHARGWTHGDVKPDNVLVSDERVCLIDLGTVAPVGQRRTALDGTLAYMAPEALRRADVAPEADLYALGVLGYYLLAGRLPFEGEPAALVRAHLAQEPAPLAGELGPVVMALLAKDPAARWKALPALGLAAPKARLQTHGWLPRPEAEEAWAAGPTCLVVEGGPGAGKGRLLDRWRLEAELAGAGWLAVGAAGAGDAPGTAARALVRLALQAVDDGGLAHGAALAEWLAGRVPEAWQDLEPRARQGAEALALAEALRACQAAQPGLVFAIDDWDLADAESRALLVRVAAALGATARWVLTRDPARGSVPVPAGAQAVSLPELEAAQVAALVELRLGSAAPAGLLAALEAAGATAPGAVDDMLGDWLGTGALEATETGWRFQGGVGRASARWRAVAAGLSEAERAVAMVAVLARPLGELAAPTVGRLSGLAERELAEALDGLAARGLVDETEGRVRWLAQALAPVIREGVDDRRWREGARALALEALGIDSGGADGGGFPKAADGVEPKAAGAVDVTTLVGARLAGLPSERLVAVAELALEGDWPALAVALAGPGAQAALELGAFARAAGIAARAAAWLDQAKPAVRRQLAFAAAEAERQLDRHEAAAVQYQAALALAPEDARALLGLAKGTQAGGRYAEAAELAARAEAAALQGSEYAVAARAALTRARCDLFAGAGEAAVVAHCERARDHAGEAGSPAMRAAALTLLGALVAQSKPQAADGALADIQEAVAITEGLGDPMGLGAALENLGNAYGALGRWREAASAFARFAALCRAAGTTAEGLSAEMNLALALSELGEPAAADLAADVAARAQAGGRKFVRAVALATLGQANWRAGRPGEAFGPLDEALELTRAIGNKLAEELVVGFRLEACTALGDLAGAERELAALEALAEVTGHAEARERVAVARVALTALRGDQPASFEAVAGLPLEAVVARRLQALMVAGEAARARELAQGWSAPWHVAAAQLQELRTHGDPDLARSIVELGVNPYAAAGAAWWLLQQGQGRTPEVAEALQLVGRLDAATRQAWGLPDPEDVVQATGGAIAGADLAHWTEWVALASSEEAIHRRLLAGLLALAKADRGYVLGYEDGRLKAAVAEGVPEAEALGEGFSASIAQEALFSGEVVYELDAASAGRWGESVMAMDLKTVLAIPYGTPDDLWGVTYLDRRDPQPVLTPDDLALMRVLVDFAAARVDTVRRAGRLAREAAYQRAAADMAFALAATTDASARRTIVLEACKALAKAETALWLARGAEGWSVVAGGEGKFSQSLLAEAVATGEAQAFMDGDAPEGWTPGQSVLGLQLRAIWCRPVGQDQAIYLDAPLGLDADPRASLAAADEMVARALPLL
jgi:serine/threonine-protein kinase